MIEKPPIGVSCNGCGLCCQTVICSAGSFMLGLVDQYGDRAKGPCPALVKNGEKWECNIVRRPKDYIASDYGVSSLRNAFCLLIGAGIGCDDAGESPSQSDLQKLSDLQQKFLEEKGIETIQKAARIVYGNR